MGGLGGWLVDRVSGEQSELALTEYFATGTTPEAITQATVIAASLEPLPEGAFPEPYRSAARVTLVEEGEDEDERLAELDQIHRGNPEATLEVYAIGEQARQRAIDRARAAGVKEPDSFSNHRRFLSRRDAERGDQIVARTLGAGSMMSLAWPVDDHFRITSPWGFRTHPLSGRKGLHNGVDVAVPVGTEVRSAQSGTVVVAAEDRINGKYVVIDHGHGVKTSYCHLSELLVARKDELTRDQPIGSSGKTGRVTGPHLHFVLRVGLKTVDPERFRPVVPTTADAEE